MSTTSTSINDLADLSLAHIFAFLSPDERVRVERVCRKWRQIAQKHAWTEFRKLMLEKKEFEKQSDKTKAKYRALIGRSTPYLRELSVLAIGEFKVEQWPMMRNLRHLRFDRCVGSDTLRAVADNLTHLQSIHFSDIDYRGIGELRINNISLQALRVPLYSSRRDSLCLGGLPSSLRSLHISFENASKQRMRDSGLIDELLELIISCCPQLAILMLPKCLKVSEQSLAKLARFERLLYLRLSFDPSDANVFGNSLAKIGAQLSALLLDVADSRILQLIAKHCPQLEHCGIGIIDCFSQGELLMSALQSVFLLAHLRSLSIGHLCYYNSDLLIMQILAAINGLNAKGTVEYLHLPQVLPLTVEFVTKLIQFNPRLHKLTCAILHNHTPDELEKLKTLMQNIEGPLELEIFSQCPIAMEFGENSKVQTREHYSPESISQTMLRQFWARVMDSVPDLGNLDN